MKFQKGLTQQDPGLPPGTVMSTSVPARSPGFISDVVVPVMQAAFTGIAIATVITFLVWKAGYDGGLGDYVTLWAGLALGIATLAWLFLLVDTRKLLWAIEKMIGQDLDGDKRAGKPAPRTLRVEVQDGNQQRVVDAEWLEIDDDRLLIFAGHIDAGRGFTEGEWGGYTAVFPEGINQFRKFRTKLEQAGMIAKTSKARNATFELTASGRAFIRRLVEYARGSG